MKGMIHLNGNYFHINMFINGNRQLEITFDTLEDDLRVIINIDENNYEKCIYNLKRNLKDELEIILK
jgi:hypothetical protein